ncbi:hypothetical protein GJAV_G00120070 [Gymnothorax javanicus]|nr:hypothetical protein GJAV_G00120070 [Gymnothorax javanicus]
MANVLAGVHQVWGFCSDVGWITKGTERDRTQRPGRGRGGDTISHEDRCFCHLGGLDCLINPDRWCR